MRISRLICSTSTMPSSRHSVAISSGAVIGENSAGTRQGSSATPISHIMRQCVNSLKVSHRSNHATRAYDTTHLGDGALCIGYEIKHDHREGPIEKVVTERQLSCVGLLERDAPVGVASARSFRIPRSQIDRRLRPRSFVRSWRIRNTHLRQNWRQGRLPMPSLL
jgi:hypothetical protein